MASQEVSLEERGLPGSQDGRESSGKTESGGRSASTECKRRKRSKEESDELNSLTPLTASSSTPVRRYDTFWAVKEPKPKPTWISRMFKLCGWTEHVGVVSYLLFVISLIVLIIWAVLLLPNYMEVPVICVSTMWCCIITCCCKRGERAKHVWPRPHQGPHYLTPEIRSEIASPKPESLTDDSVSYIQPPMTVTASVERTESPSLELSQEIVGTDECQQLSDTNTNAALA